MEGVEKAYPLEQIVNELVSAEFQYEVLTAKSAKRTECKLQHYQVLREEMITRHAWELRNMDSIIERYKKPLEIREKVLQKKEEKLKELRGRLSKRQTAIASLGSLPPPAVAEGESSSDEERLSNEIVTGVKTYTCPR